MAVRQQLIRRPPEDVWAVLEDQNKYEDWVVGTSHTEPAVGEWPEVGAELTYTVHLGPRDFAGHTIVRRCERPRILELEALSGPLGSARIALDVRPWGDQTLLIIDEHPLRGPGWGLHNAVVDAVLQLRHRIMLHRLARVVEEVDPSASGDAELSGRR